MATFDPDILNCEDDVRTLSNAVYEGHETFPLFVKICGSIPDQVVSFDLPDNTELLLQRQVKEKFAHVKVLQFNNTVTEQEYGPEFLPRHKSYVGKEYLLPLSYGGNIKFVQRPGSTGRYKNMSQVITDGQGLVQLKHTTEAMSANDPSKQVLVEAKTSLEIKRKFHDNQHVKGCLIECSDGKTSYAFKEDDCVICTAVYDDVTHNLKDVRKYNIFPRVIKFEEKVNPGEAVFRDREMNSAMQVIMKGPLELCGMEEKEFMIGTVKNQKCGTFETVLIPKQLWTLIYVRKRSFACSEERDKYINRKYEPYPNIDFVNHALYFLPILQYAVIWLMNPALCKPRLDNRITVFDAIPIPFKVFSEDEPKDDDENGYQEILEIEQFVTERESEKVKRKSSFLKIVRSWAYRKFRTLSLSDNSHEQLNKPDDNPLKPVSPDKMSEQFLKGQTIGELIADNVTADQHASKHKSKKSIERVPKKSFPRSQSEPIYTSRLEKDQGQDYIPLAFDEHKTINENKFTSENGETVEVSANEGGNYDTISDDALDSSLGSKSKSNVRKKIAKKSFLHPNIEAPICTKQHKLNPNDNRYHPRLPDDFDEDDNDNGDYEPVMGHINRVQKEDNENNSQSWNEETNAVERKSFLHSNMLVAKRVDKRKEENYKTRRDVKPSVKVDDIYNETCSNAKMNVDNTNMPNVEQIEKLSKKSDEPKLDDIKRTPLKSNKAEDKRQNRMSKEQQEKVLKDDQTEADFYNYTVAETAFCFETCGMQKLAEFCLEQKLDGSFFKNLDSDFSVLCKEVKLSKFYEYALRSIIREGYRKYKSYSNDV